MLTLMNKGKVVAAAAALPLTLLQIAVMADAYVFKSQALAGLADAIADFRDGLFRDGHASTGKNGDTRG